MKYILYNVSAQTIAAAVEALKHPIVACDTDGNVCCKSFEVPVGPSSKEIWYTSSDGDIVEAMMSPVSNVYQDGKGIMTFADDVTSIGVEAFYSRSSLTSIEIPSSVTSIGINAFASCLSLTSITIPDAVTSIGGGAFYGCSSLTSITIPSSVTSIGQYAFYTCYILTGITIPSSVTSIGKYAFSCCSSLTDLSFAGTISQWNAITKGECWNDLIPATVVHCSDGDVAL